MGFFSWKTSDTRRSISNVHSSCGAFPVYMVLPDGRVFRETEYDGYGVFGGRDFYGLVAELNGRGKPEQSLLEDPALREEEQRQFDTDFDEKHRGYGIRLCSLDNPDRKDKDILLPRFCENLKPWEELGDSEDCRHQGFFY